MGSRLGARRALVSLVVFGALAGCGDDSAVEVTATPVPTVSSATPEPSPTPTAPATAVPLPVMPPEMANNDAAGAEAAARYFFELYVYTYLTRDLDPWKQISSDDCQFCLSVADEVSEMISTDETQRGGKVVVNPDIAHEYDADLDVHVLDMVATQLAYEEVAADGAVISSNNGGTFSLSIILQMTEAGWSVLEAGSTDA